MEKINAYLSKQQKRYILAKIGIFLTKAIGFYLFICVLGLCDYSDRGGELGAIYWLQIVCVCAGIAAMDIANQHLHKFKKVCSRRYKRGLQAKTAALRED